MSEDKTTVASETVSEQPTTEISYEALQEKLKAETAYSKAQRQKKQGYKARLQELEKKALEDKENELKEKEEYKTLYEQEASKVKNLSSDAEKWAKYEETKRASLLEQHPENERETLANLPLETLEYVTSKIQIKPNAPQVIGRAKNVELEKSYDDMTPEERRQWHYNAVGKKK